MLKQMFRYVQPSTFDVNFELRVNEISITSLSLEKTLRKKECGTVGGMDMSSRQFAVEILCLTPTVKM